MHSALNTAVAVLKTFHMMRLDQLLQLVDHLRQRLYTDGKRLIIILECCEAGFHGIIHRTDDGIHLPVSIG